MIKNNIENRWMDGTVIHKMIMSVSPTMPFKRKRKVKNDDKGSLSINSVFHYHNLMLLGLQRCQTIRMTFKFKN